MSRISRQIHNEIWFSSGRKLWVDLRSQRIQWNLNGLFLSCECSECGWIHKAMRLGLVLYWAAHIWSMLYTWWQYSGAFWMRSVKISVIFFEPNIQSSAGSLWSGGLCQALNSSIPLNGKSWIPFISVCVTFGNAWWFRMESRKTIVKQWHDAKLSLSPRQPHHKLDGPKPCKRNKQKGSISSLQPAIGWWGGQPEPRSHSTQRAAAAPR